MSLPATARHRWDLTSGGEVASLDLGDALVILPGGIDTARSALIDAITDDDWEVARQGFGGPDLTNE